MEFQGTIAPVVYSTIEVVNPPIEAKEHLTAEKVKKWKVTYLKVELQRCALSINDNKSVICKIHFWKKW